MRSSSTNEICRFYKPVIFTTSIINITFIPCLLLFGVLKNRFQCGNKLLKPRFRVTAPASPSRLLAYNGLSASIECSKCRCRGGREMVANNLTAWVLGVSWANRVPNGHDRWITIQYSPECQEIWQRSGARFDGKLKNMSTGILTTRVLAFFCIIEQKRDLSEKS